MNQTKMNQTKNLARDLVLLADEDQKGSGGNHNDESAREETVEEIC